MNNVHSESIPADIIAQALAQVQQTLAFLAAYIIALTPEQRHSIAKMGNKTFSFVEKAHELALTNPTLVPPFLNMPAFTIDFSDAHNLEPLFVAVEQLRSGIDDTKMLAGSEAYHAALVFYNSAKVAASQNVPGAKAVYDELKARFPRVKRKTDGAEEVAE